MVELVPPSADEPPSFLEKAPPPLAARGLSLLMISLFAVAALLAAFVKLPETVKAPFVLVPMRGTDPVRAPRSGTVGQVATQESARVSKDALLFTLRSPGAADRASELQTAEARETGAFEGLENARAKYRGEEQSSAEEMKRLTQRSAYLERMLQLKAEQLDLSAGQAERARKLHDQGLASLDQRADALIRDSQAKMEFEQLSTEAREVRTSIEKQRHADDVRRAAFREEERGLLERIAESRFRSETLRKAEPGAVGGEVPVLAPCDGTIVRLGVLAAGAVVQEGDELAQIACAGERLQAELTLAQGGLSRTRPGLPVKLLYESFPYQRFGVRNGTLRWASPATAQAPGDAAAKDGPAFRAFVALADQTITVDGEPRPLLPGMKGTALIVVGRRSAISYAFAPLAQLQETMK